MSELLAQWLQRPNMMMYLLIAGAVVTVVETLGLLLGRRRSGRKSINKRLQALDQDNNREAVLVELRRDRGLTGDGSFSSRWQW